MLLMERLEREVSSQLGLSAPHSEAVCCFLRLEATKILPDQCPSRRSEPNYPRWSQREWSSKF
jgi:hypothetical protein